MHRNDVDELQLKQWLEFEKVADAFRSQLSEMDKHANCKTRRLYRRGYMVLHRIREIHDHAARHPDHFFDAVHYTAILEMCSRMLMNPADQEAARQLALLTKNTDDGKPSVPKKVFGAIMMFLGAAAMLIAGLGIFVATLGIGTPVSIGLGVGGAALFACGISLSVKGRDKGLHWHLGMFGQLSSRCARRDDSRVKQTNRDDIEALFMPPLPVL